MRRALPLVLAALGVALVLSACGYEGTTTPLPSSVDGRAVNQKAGAAAAPAPTTTSPAPTTTAPATTSPAPAPSAGAPKGDAAAGKPLFTSMGCAGCHTLKAAGATGTIGPNLDQLKPPEARIVTQVTNGGAIMPAFKGRMTAQQIADVAAYVASVEGT